MRELRGKDQLAPERLARPAITPQHVRGPASPLLGAVMGGWHWWRLEAPGMRRSPPSESPRTSLLRLLMLRRGGASNPTAASSRAAPRRRLPEPSRWYGSSPQRLAQPPALYALAFLSAAG